MEKYLQPIIDVCVAVFKNLLKCDLVVNRPFFTDKEVFYDWDISGLINLSGEASGIIAISMKAQTAVKIVNIITGVKHEYLDGDAIDAVGEIVNIIAGNAKKSLEDEFKILISLPHIIQGKAHVVVWPSNKSRMLCIPFEIFEGQTICISVAIDPGKPAAV
jgi:chemotaxis protein CheX